jgi:hypothetical protein
VQFKGRRDDMGDAAASFEGRFERREIRLTAGRRVPIAGVLAPAGALKVVQLLEIQRRVAGERGLLGLRVCGDALADDGIREGDFLLLETAGPAREGQNVLVEIDGRLMLRRYLGARGRRLLLAPTDREALPFLVQGDRARVRGAVAGVLRKRGFGCRPNEAAPAHPETADRSRGGGAERMLRTSDGGTAGERARKMRYLESRLGSLRRTYAGTANPRLRRALLDEARRVELEIERRSDKANGLAHTG